MNDDNTYYASCCLKEEIEQEANDMKSLEIGSDERKVAVENIAKLSSQLAEIKKLDIQEQELYEKRDLEKKNRQMKIVGYVLEGAAIVLPLLVTIWGTNKTLKFDADGQILTSTIGRDFIKKLTK